MDTTTRSVKLILELEQILKHLQTAYYLSHQEPSLDDVWRIVDEQRQELSRGLTPDEDRKGFEKRNSNTDEVYQEFPQNSASNCCKLFCLS